MMSTGNRPVRTKDSPATPPTATPNMGSGAIHRGGVSPIATDAPKIPPQGGTGVPAPMPQETFPEDTLVAITNRLIRIEEKLDRLLEPNQRGVISVPQISMPGGIQRSATIGTEDR